MSVEKLSSNVMNYLVWRYLQEAGYGSAAAELSQSWIRQPQNLPFAPNVQPHALTDLVQDGLYFDHLSAEAAGGSHRYYFGADHGRKFSVQNGGGPVLSDVASPGPTLTDSTPQLNGVAPETRPKKGARGKKKSNGTEPKMNGDAMDIEPNGVLPHSRDESEAIVSDVESAIIEEMPLPTTLENGADIDIQTEQPPQTRVLERVQVHKFDGADTSVKHITWSPFEEDILTASGQSLLRLCSPGKVNAPDTGMPPIRTKDAGLPYEHFDITAFCWTGVGRAVFAIEERSVNEKDEESVGCRLETLDANSNVASKTLASIPGTVFQLRFNDTLSGKLLLCVSGDDIKGVIRVWNTDSQDPPAMISFEKALFDAQWIGKRHLIACGDGFLGEFEVDMGTKEVNLLQAIHTNEPGERIWDKLSHNAAQRTVALKSMEGDEMVIASLTTRENSKWALPDGLITSVEFCPIQDFGPSTSSTQNLLAAACSAGYVQVWSTAGPFNVREVYRVELEGRPVNAIAWHPNEFALAAAGVDRVLIWAATEGGSPTSRWEGPSELWDISGRDVEQDEAVHRLVWDAQGKRIAFAMGNQMAIITGAV